MTTLSIEDLKAWLEELRPRHVPIAVVNRQRILSALNIGGTND